MLSKNKAEIITASVIGAFFYLNQCFYV